MLPVETKVKRKPIRFTKEYFITEKGEVIKMAAIITNNPKVKAKLTEREASRKKKN